MQYPIVFCDYDGTIFDPVGGQVPPRTIAAINAYREAGGIFVLTTGRIYSSILPRAQAIGVDKGYLVCLQGSVGYEIESGRQVFCHDLESADWHAVAAFAESQGWVCQIYHDTHFYVGEPNEYTDGYILLCGVHPIYAGEPLSGWVRATDWTSHKVIVMTPPDEAAARIAALKRAFPHLDVSQSAPRYIEVVAPDSGKGNAVKTMCARLGIDVSRSIAFGDATNDNSMLIAAGVGVAMDNAQADTKAVADLICPDVAACGVACVLEDVVVGKAIV